MSGFEKGFDDAVLPHFPNFAPGINCAVCNIRKERRPPRDLSCKRIASLRQVRVAAQNGCQCCALVLLIARAACRWPLDSNKARWLDFAVEITDHSRDDNAAIVLRCPHPYLIRLLDSIIPEWFAAFQRSRSVDLDVFVLKHERPMYWIDNVARDISRLRTKTYLALLFDWLQECEKTHTHKPTAPSRLPTRVLDVGTNRSSELRLHISGIETANYIALSHCWGKAVVVTTTSENLPQRQQGINFDELPQTFQDAITVTRNLNVRYLWIDSLCIVQDDKNDWATESGEMASVYSQAYLVIGADKSSHCHGGFLTGNDRKEFKAEPLATVSCGNDRKSVVYAQKDGPRKHGNIYNLEPLAYRAWTLQEHILASRMVHFTNSEIIWECSSHVCCECMGLDGSVPKLDNIKSQFHAYLRSEWSKSESLLIWFKIVSELLTRSITNQMDVLPCMSGIASVMQASGTGKYLAGLWAEHLPDCLLWVSYSKWQRFKPYRAPTWSWASIDRWVTKKASTNEINVHQISETDSVAITIMEAHCNAASSDPFGVVSEGYIKLRGLIIPVERLRETGLDYLRPLHAIREARSGRKDGKFGHRPQVFPAGDPYLLHPVFDIEIDAASTALIYCLLVAVEHGDNKTRYGHAIGLVLQDSEEHPGCFERIGLFQNHSMNIAGSMECLFGVVKETTITLV